MDRLDGDRLTTEEPYVLIALSTSQTFDATSQSLRQPETSAAIIPRYHTARKIVSRSLLVVEP